MILIYMLWLEREEQERLEAEAAAKGKKGKKEEKNLLDRIEQTKALAKDSNSFFTELRGKPKKFNLFAEFLGKGIFNYLEKDDNKEINTDSYWGVFFDVILYFFCFFIFKF